MRACLIAVATALSLVAATLTAAAPAAASPAVQHTNPLVNQRSDWDYRARLEAGVKPLADSQFRLVPGLAGGGSVSLESTNFPGYYLRHSNFEGWVRRDDGTAAFRADASFTRRAGLAGGATVSFESVNYPGRYLRHYENAIVVQAVSTATERADATFVLE